MQGMDGFETCQKIREAAELNTKIIIYTGNADAVDAGKAKEVGADEYCVKTSDYSFILDSIKKFIN